MKRAALFLAAACAMLAASCAGDGRGKPAYYDQFDGPEAMYRCSSTVNSDDYLDCRRRAAEARWPRDKPAPAYERFPEAK